MRRKLLSITLATTLMASMFVGCSSNDAAKDGGNNTDSKASVDLELGIWPSDELADDIKTFEGYQATMKELHPEVNVIPKHYTYATDTFVSLATSGNCPTIYETWYTEPQKLIKQGLACDITAELKEKGWDADMSETVKELMSDENGNIYGIPRDAYVLGVMCNVELFEEAGLVDANGVPIFPKTMDELAQTAKTIKDKTGAAGFCLLAKDGAGGWHFSNIAWNFGATLCTRNDDGTYTCDLDSDAAIAAMKWVYDLKWKYDVLTADPTSEDWGSGFMQLGTGACAMYIGANDAVAQPTQVNGLPADKLAMCAMPAGPNGDRYSLTGGTPYMFSKDATSEEIKAALDFVEIMGKSPVVNETSIKGMKASAADRVTNGVPVIKSFPCWTNKEFLDAEAEVIAEYQNVDAALYDSYFNDSTNVRPEEPGEAQSMYTELTNVLQAVVTDKDCDIPALMKQADENYQKILDEKFPAK